MPLWRKVALVIAGPEVVPAPASNTQARPLHRRVGGAGTLRGLCQRLQQAAAAGGRCAKVL